jgi:uncharacterized protein
MLTAPLPRALDIRKAATRGLTVSGTLKPSQLPRFRVLLAGDGGSIAAEFAFFKDEQGRHLVRVRTRAEVEVVCQRCLQVLPLDLESDNTLAVVWSDEQASELPRHLEPLLLAVEDDGSLWEVVEDELILALPAFNYHDTEQCRETLTEFTAPPTEQTRGADRPNPFNMLAQLKPGEKTRS